MIEHLFRLGDNDTVFFDSDGVRLLTEDEFVDTVVARIGTDQVKEIKYGGDRRERFVYFRTAAGYFSFAWDKRASQLLFSEQVNKKWRFVVGWRPEA